MLDNELEKLYKDICSKKNVSSKISYTAKLFKKGRKKILKKLGEEASELIIGASYDDRDNVVYESVDVLYHMLVLWSEMGIDIGEIESEISKRSRISGIEEKLLRGEKKEDV